MRPVSKPPQIAGTDPAGWPAGRALVACIRDENLISKRQHMGAVSKQVNVSHIQVEATQQHLPEPLQRCRNLPGRRIRRGMFPNAKDYPAVRLQTLVDCSVSFNIPTQLARPILSIHDRVRPVLRAAMPVAAIDKNCQTAPSEDNIRPCPQVGRLYRETHPKAQAWSMQC
jgi:hypothetical protein